MEDSNCEVYSSGSSGALSAGEALLIGACIGIYRPKAFDCSKFNKPNFYCFRSTPAVGIPEVGSLATLGASLRPVGTRLTCLAGLSLGLP